MQAHATKTRRAAAAAAAVLWTAASASAAPLWSELMATTERHIESQGPDSDSADFISRSSYEGWKERETLFRLTRKFLDSDKPAQVAGAYEVLYRLRSFRPLNWIGGGQTFEEQNADFFRALDQAALDHVAHAIAMHDDDVFRACALYLGVSRAPGAHDALRRIVSLAPDNEQALICLTWQRNPSDMVFLLPIMLGDAKGAAHLPSQFRDSYGEAARPYLRQAASEARQRFVREEATEALRILDGGSPQ